MAVLAVTVGIVTVAPPAAEAASIPAYNGRPTGNWVDGSGRLYTLFSSTDTSFNVNEVQVARHQAGTVTLDTTYATSGIRKLALVNPYSWSGDFYARVVEAGFTSDGTVVVVWLGTGSTVKTMAGKSVREYSHNLDRLVIDRYDLSGTRLSRADVAMPRNSWCDWQYGEYRWLEDIQQWFPDPYDFCGDYSTIEPSIEVLANGTVAVPTYGGYQYPGGGGQANGTSSVVFFEATSGAQRLTVGMPVSREVSGRVDELGSTGAVFNTYDWANGAASTGPSYVVTGWSSSATRSVGAGCELWPGAGDTTVRTCPATGSVAINAFNSAGSEIWSRSLPAVRGALQVGPQPDGRISLVAFGCETAGGTCDTFDMVALRFGSTGTIERNYVGRFHDAATGTNEYVWEVPVAFADGKQAVAVDQRPPGPNLNNTVITKLLQGTPPPPPTVPAKPAAPSVVPGPARVDVSWTAPGNGGSAITGYRVTPYKNGVAQAPVDVGAVTSRSFTGLTNGSSYRFSVAARNSVGLGPASDLSVAAVPASVPGAPTGVAATAGKNSATVAWTAPASDGGSPITAYRLRVSANGNPLQDITVGPVLTTTLLNLTPGTIYTFELAAVNRIGTGPDSATSNPVTPPPAGFASWPAMVTRQYQDLLNRPATSTESASWTSTLQPGTQPAGALPAALRTSADHTTNVDPVTRLYSAYLNRIPDRGGLIYWINKRRAGSALTAISSAFASSNEFKTKYGSLSNRDFVELVYTNVLGRPGDTSGINYWTSQLDRHLRTRGQVMVGFSESSEYIRTQTPRVNVIVLYVFMLGRTPTADELATEVTALNSGGTVTQLAQRILDSDAYATRIAGLP